MMPEANITTEIDALRQQRKKCHLLLEHAELKVAPCMCVCVLSVSLDGQHK